MDSEILDHYKQFGIYTNPGLYREKLRTDLPDDVREIGHLVRRQIIHRMTLIVGNQGSNTDMRYGDMTKVPWWRQPEDDVLVTVSAMLAELYRRDDRGFVSDRSEENKLILTCRFVAILMASVLKSKGIAARVRSGFATYATPRPDVNCDHWITQYWHESKDQWITIDADCCFEDLKFDAFDMPENIFEWSADVWLKARRGEVDPKRYWNAGGFEGLMPISWELFYDLHCLMNSEIIYLHAPDHVALGKFEKLTESELAKIDKIALLMQNPDENFQALQNIWQTKKEVRLLSGALLQLGLINH